MSLSKLAAAALLSLTAIALPIDQASAGDPEVCEEIKSKASCPPKFAIVELPGSPQAQTIARDEGFVLYHECGASKGGMNCTGWPQEQAGAGNLSYEWSFESNGRKLSLAPGASARQFFGCNDGEQVTATLTIANGKYRASSSETYTCGKQDR
jgi:hypothetical protein